MEIFSGTIYMKTPLNLMGKSMVGPYLMGKSMVTMAKSMVTPYSMAKSMVTPYSMVKSMVTPYSIVKSMVVQIETGFSPCFLWDKHRGFRRRFSHNQSIETTYGDGSKPTIFEGITIQLYQLFGFIHKKIGWKARVGKCPN